MALPERVPTVTRGGDARVATARLPEAVYTGPSLRGLRVLAVDDDPDALELMKTVLVASGAETIVCRSATEALTLLPSWRPHVLVSDIEMPGEDGYSLIRSIRALPCEKGGKIPAVALTGYGRPEDRMKALLAGYNMHVPKPVDPAELGMIVAGLADHSPTDRAGPDSPRRPRSLVALRPTGTDRHAL